METRHDDETGLSRHVTVAALVRVYEQARADVLAGFELLAKAEREVNAAFTMANHVGIDVCRSRHRSIKCDSTASLDATKRSAWEAIVERLEIRRLLSIARAKELDERLSKGELPELTIAAVADFAAFYQEHAGDMLEEAVDEVFNLLRPRGDAYKSNSQFEIGKRVVLCWMVENGFRGLRVRWDRQSELLALNNVFSMLDGRGSIAKTYLGPLTDAINAKSSGETDYFRYRAFRNGNLHLEFRRPDLVARLNKIAGGRRLKPQSAAA
jgi:hypothetical protein